MKRHIGKLKNTDARCVVVFMQLPDRPTHALIIPVEGLSDRVEQALMGVVESREGQAAPTLAFVLERRLFPDTGKNMLVSLHNAGLLKDVPVDQVIMLPRPNMPFPLKDIIEQMGGTVPTTPLPPADDTSALEKYNPHTENSKVQTAEERKNIALNLLRQADDLLAESNHKRREAYRFAPELNTDGVKAETALVEEETVIIPVEKIKRAKKDNA